MSHFTLQIDPRGGPVLNVLLGVSEPRVAALIAAGKLPVPQGVPIRALVDTGASSTCVDRIVLEGALKLNPTGQVECFTPSTGTTPASKDVFDVSLRILGTTITEPTLYFPTIAVMESELFAAQGIHALIGRDVLERCLLTYNGAVGQFTLAF